VHKEDDMIIVFSYRGRLGKISSCIHLFKYADLVESITKETSIFDGKCFFLVCSTLLLRLSIFDLFQMCMVRVLIKGPIMKFDKVGLHILRQPHFDFLIVLILHFTIDSV
jgi:hypothetical protein